jgi:tetratricopeptide (TPR) repeat protein
MYIASLAGLLLFWPDERMRDPGQAMELTKRVLESSPDGAKGWSLLGAGRYRTGDYQGAIVALKKAMQFSQANAGSDPGIPAPAAESPTPMQMSATPAPFFAIYFAMAHAKLGEPVEARKWYEQALAWWDNHTSPTAEDHQVIAEAAQLLGLPAPTPKK